MARRNMSAAAAYVEELSDTHSMLRDTIRNYVDSHLKYVCGVCPCLPVYPCASHRRGMSGRPASMAVPQGSNMLVEVRKPC